MTATLGRYEQTWTEFLVRLEQQPTLTLASHLKELHINADSMKKWMGRNNKSVKEAKKALLSRKNKSKQETNTSLFTPMNITDVPYALIDDCDVCDIMIRFPEGVEVNIKQTTPKAIVSLIKLYNN